MEKSENKILIKIEEIENGNNSTIDQQQEIAQMNAEERKVFHLISSWGFDYKVIKKFIDHKITIWHLENIDAADLNEFFSNPAEIATRIEFRYFHKKWLDAKNKIKKEKDNFTKYQNQY